MRKIATATLSWCLIYFSVGTPVLAGPDIPTAAAVNTVVVRMETSMGNLDIALNQDKAPKTVANFLRYVDEGFYSNTLFHRVIPGFMIQGGGFTAGMNKKNTRAPVPNEADNGLKNTTGTIAMARTGDPHSATAQFFINTVDNVALNHRGKNVSGWGYTVFGKVVTGMDVVRKIENAKTRSTGRYQDVPVEDIMIRKVYRLEPPAK